MSDWKHELADELTLGELPEGLREQYNSSRGYIAAQEETPADRAIVDACRLLAAATRQNRAQNAEIDGIRREVNHIRADLERVGADVEKRFWALLREQVG